MNTNRPQRFNPSQTPKFKLPSFEEDKRLAFVDSVCATLMTSRFGWGAMYTLNPRFEGTADEPLDFLDTMEEELCGWHEAATFLGRTILGHACLDALPHEVRASCWPRWIWDATPQRYPEQTWHVDHQKFLGCRNF